MMFDLENLSAKVIDLWASLLIAFLRQHVDEWQLKHSPTALANYAMPSLGFLIAISVWVCPWFLFWGQETWLYCLGPIISLLVGSILAALISVAGARRKFAKRIALKLLYSSSHHDAMVVIEDLKQGGWLINGLLCGVDLEAVNLQGADLHQANLSRANLIKANLEGVCFTGASLFETNLKRANLRGTDLERAYLVGANLIL